LLQEELRGKLEAQIPADASFYELAATIKKCQLFATANDNSIECL